MIPVKRRKGKECFPRLLNAAANDGPCWHAILDFLDHPSCIEVIISLKTMPWTIIFTCPVMFWSWRSAPAVFERGTVFEPFTPTTGYVDDKPLMTTLLGFVTLDSAHFDLANE